jgi:uncharacterized membrane protein
MRSSTGLAENVAGALCYLLGWITGLIFLVLEQQSGYVRYHAMQSVVVFGGIAVASLVLGLLSGIGLVLQQALALLSVILWILLMVKAWQGERYRLTWISDVVDRLLAGMGPLR